MSHFSREKGPNTRKTRKTPSRLRSRRGYPEEKQSWEIIALSGTREEKRSAIVREI